MKLAVYGTVCRALHEVMTKRHERGDLVAVTANPRHERLMGDASIMARYGCHAEVV